MSICAVLPPLPSACVRTVRRLLLPGIIRRTRVVLQEALGRGGERMDGWMVGGEGGRREVGPLLESRVILLCCQRTPKDKEPDFRLRMAGITIRQGATDG